MEHQDEDIKEAKARMQQMRTAEKEQYDQVKNLIKEPPKKGDLVLLHNSKLKTSHSAKLKFCWSGPYQVHKVIKEKSTYFLEELDGTLFRENFHENQLKRFWMREGNFYTPMSIEEKEEAPTSDPAVSKVPEQNNESNTSYISPGKDFAVLI